MDPLAAIVQALDVIDPHRIDNEERAMVILCALDARGFTILRDAVAA